MIKKITAGLFASLFMLGLFGCNTMEGAGKDIERGGEKIQEKADR
jgi:predicted small secreted protein